MEATARGHDDPRLAPVTWRNGHGDRRRTRRSSRPQRAQVAYFETFGYLKLPGLLADDIDEITEAFEAVFADEANPRWETYEELHLRRRRLIIPAFIDRHPRLARLRDDPRVSGIVRSLIGPDYEYAESDGNIFSCESSWHADTYSAGLGRLHVKASIYLDPLSADSGAIRVIPGTNFHHTSYAQTLRRELEHADQIESHFGIDGRDIPSWAISSVPGDVVVWNFRTIHASYNGGERRRLFSINFREPKKAEA